MVPKVLIKNTLLLETQEGVTLRREFSAMPEMIKG